MGRVVGVYINKRLLSRITTRPARWIRKCKTTSEVESGRARCSKSHAAGRAGSGFSKISRDGKRRVALTRSDP